MNNSANMSFDHFNRVAQALNVLAKAFREMRDVGLDDRAIHRVVRGAADEIGRNISQSDNLLW